jgi:ubiquinone/menaquinone biosynthesis C-methylase UbiE
MKHSEILDLIRGGITAGEGSSIWADFGAGWGNFTRALRDLVGNEAVIYAIDRDPGAFAPLRENHGERGILHTITADFTRPLPLPALDGALMANALHFVRDQQSALALVRSCLKPGGRLILVEYDFKNPRPWVPYPVSSERFPALMTAAGFHHPEVIVTRRSPSTGVVMYAGVALHSGENSLFQV